MYEMGTELWVELSEIQNLTHTQGRMNLKDRQNPEILEVDTGML